MTGITVRPVTPADTEAWLEMRTELWPHHEANKEDIATFFRGVHRHGLDAALAAVAEGGAIVGFAELSIRGYAEGCDTDRVGYLEGWFVAEPHRHTGIGRALVRAAEDWARTHGCTEFASGTDITNLISATAHEALGFTEVERQIHYRKDL